jgi:hypothetical protein
VCRIAATIPVSEEPGGWIDGIVVGSGHPWDGWNRRDAQGNIEQAGLKILGPMQSGNASPSKSPLRVDPAGRDSAVNPVSRTRKAKNASS